MASSLPPPTEEVLRIIEDLRQGFNPLVIAWPGTGKTSLALEIARVFAHLKILLIVYNAALKSETREKIKKYGLTNMTCHSFHACASAHMKEGCSDDEMLEGALKVTELRKDLDFDIIIWDESQDVRDLFWRFIARCCAFRAASSPAPFQMVHLGDPFQCVYRKMGADVRYLTLAHMIYPPEFGGWTHRELTLSHRLTVQIAGTVNDLFLRRTGAIRSVREGPPVEFFLGDAYKTVKEFARIIGDLISSGACTAGDVMVIAPSVKKCMEADTPGACQPVVDLARRLGKHLVHVDHHEDGGVKEEVARNKILFTNQCQPKGTERTAIFVLGVDMSLQKYFSGNADITEFHTVPSTVFVAVTRSRKYLYIQADDEKHGFLPFFDDDALLRGSPSWKVTRVSETRRTRPTRTIAPAGAPAKPKKYRATDLSRHIEQRAAKEVQSIVRWKRHENSEWKKIQVDCVRKCEREGVQYAEQVSDIVGLAIPALLEEVATKRLSTIRDFVWARKAHPKLTPYAQIVNDAVGGGGDETSALNGAANGNGKSRVGRALVTILKSCVLYDALKSGYFNRVRQISGYGGWLRTWQLKALLERGGQIWPMEKGLRCEVTASAVFDHPTHGPIQITGRVDVICGDTVWETKCLSGALGDDHRLQLLVYAYIFGSAYKYKLINLFSGECIEVIYDKGRIIEAMETLISHKFDQKPDKTDDEFLSHARRLWAQTVVI